MKKIRVLVVDDSALMRKLIPQMLAGDESIEVVGTAMDGSFCLKKIEELKPNVVTLDLEMPGMNGIDTLKEIMRRQPVPVIVFSSHSTEGATVTMKALGLGAFDFVPKPKDPSAHMAEVARERIRTLVESNDGFYIADMDMRLRGPGEFFGTKQSGIPGLRIANLFRDADLLELARSEAQALVNSPENSETLRDIVQYIQEHWQRQYGLVQVG